MSQVYLYHSNDLHSHFAAWTRVSGFFKRKREERKKNNEEAFFFDIGDHMDRAHWLSDATKGKANVTLMNEVGFDAVTFGNNEGITLAKESLDQLYKEATFPVLAANVYEQNGERPKWVKPYQVYTLNNNMKVAVIGLTVKFSKFYEQLGWSISSPYQELDRYLPELNKKADVIVLLSHLGIKDDEAIAKAYDIDVIMGGHTHHLFEDGKIMNGTLLAAAAKHGKYAGEICLTFDDKERKLIKKTAIAYSMEEEAESSDTKHLLHSLEHEADSLHNEEVVHLKKPLSLSWFSDSLSTKLLAQGLREWVGAEAAMLNAGVILQDLPVGSVTKKDLHRICPHPINPCKVILTGAELVTIIEKAFTREMQELEFKGLGFRGKVMGAMVFDNLLVEWDELNDEAPVVKYIILNGEQVKADREYEIATLDMFTFGYLYPEMSKIDKKTYYMPEMLRDVLAWKLQNTYK
ncbi:bifunctional UDP-sugar hydrolase/5'-nucleotidase [Bacillus tianshenii]|nr:bifunctional UDP-sugar hydrolase/5'-nucleotidase [Bacillus tianshenii]